MENQFNPSANRICMIVVEAFQAVNEIDVSSIALNEPGDVVLFTFANDSFIALREVISAHCRPYRSSLAASQ